MDWVVSGNEIVENQTIGLDGDLTIEPTGHLTLRQVTLTLLNAAHGEHGIRIKGGGAMTIDADSLLTTASNDARMYFVVEEDASLVMRSSELRRCGWPGVSLWESNGLQIFGDIVLEDNLLTEVTQVGIYPPGSGGRLVGNRFEGDSHLEGHLIIQFRSGLTITNNTFGPNDFFGISLWESHSNVIRDNEFDHVAHGPVVCRFSWNNEFSHNRAVGGAGPYVLQRSGNTTIVDNTFEGSDGGVTVMHSTNTTIMRNRFMRAENWEVLLSYSSGNVVADNIVDDTAAIEMISPGTEASIELYHASDNLIANNTLSSLVWSGKEQIGILLWGSSSDNVIRSNLVGTTRRGVSVHYGSDNNMITHNSFGATTEEPVVVEESAGNTIHHNNFLEYERDPFDDTGLNSWDDGMEGNFWGERGGGASSPYPIPSQGTDRRPLAAAADTTPTSVAPNSPQPMFIPYPPDLHVDSELEIAQTTSGPFGTVRVMDGGRLTLRDATLYVVGGSLGVLVESGGVLEVHDSRIVPPSSEQGGFFFWAHPGSTLVMTSSEVRGVGAWPGCGDWGSLFLLESGVVIEDSVFGDCMCGLHLRGDDNTVKGNTLSHMLKAIAGEGHGVLNDSRIIGNRISRCLHTGITAGERNLILGNTVSRVWGRGIHSIDASAIENNIVTDVIDGIILSGESSVSKNAVSGARELAMYVYGADSTIIGNTFESSGLGLGVELEGCVVHHNNFIDNTVQASCPRPCLTTWHDGAQGNYWSDYHGSDANRDGVGDTPHPIEGGGQDDYPLMRPVSPPPRRSGGRLTPAPAPATP